MGPIFNEKIAEKWNLWVHEQCTIYTDWLKKNRKVKVCGYCSLNNTWTVVADSQTRAKKKKKKTQTQTRNMQTKPTLKRLLIRERKKNQKIKWNEIESYSQHICIVFNYLS